MQKLLAKNNIRNYNEIILDVNEYMICEPYNPYGHSDKFIKLKNDRKYEAHRVISPIAIKLATIETTYSVTDINGTTYVFDIFQDGDYRISDIIKLKEKSKEVAHGTNPNKNS